VRVTSFVASHLVNSSGAVRASSAAISEYHVYRHQRAIRYLLDGLKQKAHQGQVLTFQALTAQAPQQRSSLGARHTTCTWRRRDNTEVLMIIETYRSEMEAALEKVAA